MWKKLVKSSHGIDSNFSLYHEFSKVQRGPIKAVISTAKKWQCLDNVLRQSFSVKLGNGQRTLFWNDLLTDCNQPLKIMLPRLFLISNQKDELVRDMGFWNSGDEEWGLR